MAKSGEMSSAQIQEWLRDPPVFPGEKKADALLTQIKLQAIRAEATASVGGSLEDKNWRKLASTPEWLA